MGDRACVVVRDADEQVALYTHWSGYRVLEDVRTAIDRGRDRWDDAPYLARIIFCQMVGVKSFFETTGYGIRATPPDDARVVYVDTQNGTIEYENDDGVSVSVSFEDFVSSLRK